MDRRQFLKYLFSVPMLGAVALFASPLFRYLRPTSTPLAKTALDTTSKKPWEWVGQGGLFSKPDRPQSEHEIVFDLSQFPGPWSSQTFTFGQKSREYTFQHFQSIKIPGFIVRLPEDKDGKPDFCIVSRICPHMGCVFNFLSEPNEAANYNYPVAKNPLFACPCHLSVFDPLQKQDAGSGPIRGKVVSGPAPRPPRQFQWEIRGNQVAVIQVETGGIA